MIMTLRLLLAAMAVHSIAGVITTQHRRKTSFFSNLERKLQNQSDSDEDSFGGGFGTEYLGKVPLNFAHNSRSLKNELTRYVKNTDDLLDSKVREAALNVYIANAEFLKMKKKKTERRMSLVPADIFNEEKGEKSVKAKSGPTERRLKVVRKEGRREKTQKERIDGNYDMFKLAEEGRLFDIDEKDMYDIGQDDLTKFHGDDTRETGKI